MKLVEPWLAVTFLAIAPTLGWAQARPLTGADVLARYSALRSYCDAGTREGEPGYAGPFERCASADGRFRQLERQGPRHFSVRWADGATHYSYIEGGSESAYHEFSLDDPRFDRRYAPRSQIFALFVFEAFARNPPRSSRELAEYMAAFSANGALSNAQYTVLERQENVVGSNFPRIERLWIQNSDRSIRKYEHAGSAGPARTLQLARVDLDRPLADAELRYEAPLLARYSPARRPAVYIGALMAAAALLGALFWGWRFARAPAPDTVLGARRLLWRVLAIAFACTAAALGALAAFAPSGGHPPAIVFVAVLAIWCAIAFGMAACFLLASYPAQLLRRR